MPGSVDDRDSPRHSMRRRSAESFKPAGRRLVLCFDGTTNSFRGNTSDTNVVKLYNAFDRSSPEQLHYYQPGIGTYMPYGSNGFTSVFSRAKTLIDRTIDAGFATSFDAHVMEGYRFVMRFYEPNDRIYIFGFSRGAYTARFLARMLRRVGLLSRGNEEMVPFAYKVYQDYDQGRDPGGRYLKTFRATFCRLQDSYSEKGHDASLPPPVPNGDNCGVQVHFLGLFDTVGSVGVFDNPFRKQPRSPPPVAGTAKHVRHAVAVDERRNTFRPALLAQDVRSNDDTDADALEVWFPGEHQDIGGGWTAQGAPESSIFPEKSLMGQIRSFLHLDPAWTRTTTSKTANTQSNRNEPHISKDADDFQLSDIPLKWMMQELERLPDDQIQWDEAVHQDFLTRFDRARLGLAKEVEVVDPTSSGTVDTGMATVNDPIQSRLHDELRFGGGALWITTLCWKVVECLPLIRRLECQPTLVQGVVRLAWRSIVWPPTFGSSRDIPPGALFHRAVHDRLELFPKYRPNNHTWIGDKELRLHEVADLPTEQMLAPGRAHKVPRLVEWQGLQPSCEIAGAGPKARRVYDCEQLMQIHQQLV